MQLLGDKQQLNNVIEQILLEKYRAKDGPGNTKLIRDFLEKHGKVLGLPPPEAHEAIYNEVFLAVDDKKNNEELEKGEFGALVEDILEKFADELEANPVFDNWGGRVGIPYITLIWFIELLVIFTALHILNSMFIYLFAYS